MKKTKKKRESDEYMKTKKALAGLFGLLGSFAALPDFLPTALAGFLFTESLSPHK